MSPLEIAAVVFTLICVILTVRQNVLCWPIGIVGVILYGVVFYQSRLYADMGLQVVYVIFSVYGWYEWIHGGAGGGELQVSNASRSQLLISCIAGVSFALALGTLLGRATNAALPYVDSTLSSFSLVAQWLMTKKLIENWLVWLSVDVAYVGMFFVKGLYLTAVLYAVFLVLVVMGYREWKEALPQGA